MRGPTILPVIFAVAGLAACAGPSEYVVRHDDPSFKIDTYYESGAANRDLKLVVSGNPFAMPGDAFARAVESELTGSSLGRQPTNPKLTPDASANKWFRMVLVFAPPADLHGDAICSEAPPKGATQATLPNIEAVGAFCFGPRALTSVEAGVTAAAPTDPSFKVMVAQIEATLFRPDRSFSIDHGPPKRP